MTSLRFAAVGLLLALFAGTAFGQSVKNQFSQLASEENNQAKIVQLWKQHPFQTLPTIDSYLEGSLKIVESSAVPDQATIDRLHAKAMRGAAAADEAFDTVVFSEYASAFAGWDAAQQKQFRAGQKAFGDAMTARLAGDFATALAEGQSCVDKATPLGDWWGMAMGYSAVGHGNNGLGNHEKALTAFTQSRVINHQLRLGGPELACTVEMVELLQKLGRPARAGVTCDQGISLGKKLGDGATVAKLEKVRAALAVKK